MTQATNLDKRAGDAGYATPPIIAEELMSSLCRAPWPNNLRQLDATVHRLLVEAEEEPMIQLTHCRDVLAYLRRLDQNDDPRLTDESVMRALQSAGGNVSAAARLLGVDRSTVHRFQRRAKSR